VSIKHGAGPAGEHCGGEFAELLKIEEGLGVKGF